MKKVKDKLKLYSGFKQHVQLGIHDYACMVVLKTLYYVIVGCVVD